MKRPPLPPPPPAILQFTKGKAGNLWLWLAYGFLALSILKGIRYPNGWVYSHFLFNYDFGFIRRGLIGEVFSTLNHPYFRSYEFCVIFWLVIFAISMALLAYLLRSLIRSGNPLLIACAIVFAASIAVVYSANTYGYPDRFGLLVVLLSLLITPFYKKLLFLALTTPVALLVHEAFLLLFFPFLLMTLLFAATQQQQTKLPFALLAAYAVGTLIITSVISQAGKFNSDTVALIYQTYSNEAGYRLHPDPFGGTLQMNMRDHLTRRGITLTDPKHSLRAVVFSTLSIVPVVYLLLKTAQLLAYKMRRLYRSLSVLACLSPLLLHVIAHDSHRWNALVVMLSFLMVVATYQYYYATLKQKQLPTLNHKMVAVAVLSMFLSGVAIPLIGATDSVGALVRGFVLLEHWDYLLQLLSGAAQFPTAPPYYIPPH